MTSLRAKLSAALPLCILLLLTFPAPAASSAPQGAQDQPAQTARRSSFSTPEQLEEDVKAVPCKSNDERLKAVRALFEKMGARPADISVESRNDVENVVVRKPGATAETIVVGAHYDKVSHGCGAVDNWTGVVAVAHLYRTVREMPLRKTVLFVAFGREEEGLVGSREMARAIPKEEAARYCGMINVDSLGLGIPQAENHMSSDKLVRRAAELAKRMEMPFQRGSIFEADSDSTSFRERGIPAISIHGLSNEWRRVLHTNDDRVSKVNTMSVFMGYRLALALLGELENSACDAFR